MHNTERIMIQEQLSELFDLADELRRRIDELAEMVANPPAQAQVLQLHRRATFDMDHLPKLGLHQNPE